jgi:hypothetical protein
MILLKVPPKTTRPLAYRWTVLNAARLRTQQVQRTRKVTWRRHDPAMKMRQDNCTPPSPSVFIAAILEFLT